jgi:hypothetical protein
MNQSQNSASDTDVKWVSALNNKFWDGFLYYSAQRSFSGVSKVPLAPKSLSMETAEPMFGLQYQDNRQI